MSLEQHPLIDCNTQTPLRLPPRKRTKSHASVNTMHSAKRRRISLASTDLDRELQLGSGSTTEPTRATPSTLDRFIPSRPKTSLPLNITPRTNRISRQFGLTDDRIFNFTDDQENTSPSSTRDTNMLGLLRRSASSLFYTPPASRPTSVTENLTIRKQCVLTLDGPGMPVHPYAYPITWSKRNLIAVACGNDVFYQNLNNKVVSHLFKLEADGPGRLHVVEWAGEGKESILASGTTTGIVQVWDAGRNEGPGTFLRMWRENQPAGVGALDWKGDILAVGSYDGSISLFDVREKAPTRRITSHKGKVLGIKWSSEGNYLASGDDLGMAYIWDKRAAKAILDVGSRGVKMRHAGAAVKALAWCPWKPDLLATGTSFPDGNIRIWSASNITSTSSPLETITLNTSVLSLQWSPHCKELLSTHGSSFDPAAAAGHNPVLKALPSPLMNSIAVHDYPSGKRLLTLTAHLGPVSHSCLGPDGQDLFTVCPKEETIKMWHVWNKRSGVGKRESAFDKCAIR